MKRSNIKSTPIIAGLLTALLLSGCVSNQPKLGGGDSLVTGSHGADGTQDASDQLLTCARPIGTAALVEPGSMAGGYSLSGYGIPGMGVPVYGVGYGGFASYGLSSPIPVLKLIMAQSGCFKVVDRGAGAAMLQRERDIARSGQLEKGANMGPGQLAAADYIITPNITRGNNNASGGGALFGGLMPGLPGLALAAISVKNLEAEVMLSVTNVRTGVQEAVAQGSASKTDFGLGGGGYGWLIGGLGGGYQNTDMGKMVAAAFVDAHNKLVTQLGGITRSASRSDNAGYRTTAQVNLRSGPSPSSPVLASIAKNTHVSASGVAVNGWWEVDVHGHSGWIYADYIAR